MKLGIQYGPFSPKIWAGRLNKAEREFLDKQDVTDAAVFAVAELVVNDYKGCAVNTFTNGHTGKKTRYVITVTEEPVDE